MESQIKLPWNCLTINDDTEASICLKKIQWLTEDLKEESGCSANNAVNRLFGDTF